MQGHQLILFALLVTITYATEITFFGAYETFPIIGNQSTVDADQIVLFINVTKCPTRACSCEVTSNASNNALVVNFSTTDSGRGNVKVEQLQADTIYSFELTCVGADESVKLVLKTDFGRPSAPERISCDLNANHVHLSWHRPSTPAGPIHNYRLTLNRTTITESIPGDATTYTMTNDYVLGTEYNLVLTACNTNRKNESICSDPNLGSLTFYMEATTTSTPKPSPANRLFCFITYPVILLFISLNVCL
ncbi:unnamed protein product [Adineta ricciae]|uniref:Fibronectin type-III domain-containing protein n=1 Tax=Adineta ricciae TaxID=249248 RepID=A0A815VXG3_ADIRI|nr:unnamed protein product [Adineta ricciae]